MDNFTSKNCYGKLMRRIKSEIFGIFSKKKKYEGKFNLFYRIGAERIYCLMRPKKGQTPDERIRQILDGPV